MAGVADLQVTLTERELVLLKEAIAYKGNHLGSDEAERGERAELVVLLDKFLMAERTARTVQAAEA